MIWINRAHLHVTSEIQIRIIEYKGSSRLSSLCEGNSLGQRVHLFKGIEEAFLLGICKIGQCQYCHHILYVIQQKLYRGQQRILLYIHSTQNCCPRIGTQYVYRILERCIILHKKNISSVLYIKTLQLIVQYNTQNFH